MVKTLCPIKDIRGWHRYSNCPYTKSLYAKAGISGVLHTSARKEKFFNILQKNTGRQGYLTKDAMKKTLGEFKHELGANDFYKLCVSIFPDEKQRFSVSSNAGNVGEKVTADRGMETKRAQKAPTATDAGPRKIQSTTDKEMNTLRLRTVSLQRFSREQEESDRRKNDPKGSGFFRAIRTTIGKN